MNWRLSAIACFACVMQPRSPRQRTRRGERPITQHRSRDPRAEPQSTIPRAPGVVRQSPVRFLPESHRRVVTSFGLRNGRGVDWRATPRDGAGACRYGRGSRRRHDCSRPVPVAEARPRPRVEIPVRLRDQCRQDTPAGNRPKKVRNGRAAERVNADRFLRHLDSFPEGPIRRTVPRAISALAFRAQIVGVHTGDRQTLGPAQLGMLNLGDDAAGDLGGDRGLQTQGYRPGSRRDGPPISGRRRVKINELPGDPEPVPGAPDAPFQK